MTVQRRPMRPAGTPRPGRLLLEVAPEHADRLRAELADDPPPDGTPVDVEVAVLPAGVAARMSIPVDLLETTLGRHD